MTGDVHCRGVRIVVNNTFTAGGLSAPLFVVVYGMTVDEMPGDDIITIEVPGLTVGSDLDVYSSGVGYLTFVRGNYEGVHTSNGNTDGDTDGMDVDRDTDGEDEETIKSKESRIAELYRHTLYHPFIRHVRMSKYGWDGDEDSIPDYLRVVSWMDGANGQIRLIVSEENLKEEDRLCITCCKHSAARTAVEQAADTGPMFKLLKKIIHETDSPHAAFDSIYYHLSNKIDELREGSHRLPGSTDILNLTTHKKEAILATVPKLPIASGRAYTTSNVKKAFVLNGQIDLNKKLVPDIANLLHTYRGDIQGTCLENYAGIMSDFYAEVYNNGVITEQSFDAKGIPVNTDSKGQEVQRNSSISQENCQQAKILSSDAQIAERRSLVYARKYETYGLQKKLYDRESNEYRLNGVCELKLLEIIQSSSAVTNHGVLGDLTYDMLKDANVKVLCTELRAFVRVRSRVTIRQSSITYIDVPSKKAELQLKVVELRSVEVCDRVFADCPMEPELEIGA